MLLEIRGTSLKFSSNLKKEKLNREKTLMKLIEKSESYISNPICTDQCDHENLDNWKLELRAIRESKLKGHMVRARVQWSHLGERPTKFFCSLEQKHYIEKTVRKIQTEERRIITDQADILKEIEHFYSQIISKQRYRNI